MYISHSNNAHARAKCGFAINDRNGIDSATHRSGLSVPVNGVASQPSPEARMKSAQRKNRPGTVGASGRMT